MDESPEELAQILDPVPGWVTSQSMIAIGTMSRKMKLGWDRFR